MGTRDGLNSYVAELYGILMSVQNIRQTRPIVRQDRHTLASQTTEKNGSDRIRAPMAGLKRLKSALIRGGRKRIQAEWTPHFEKNQTVGAFTRKLDGALPQRHTLKLYNNTTTQESPTFIQLRTDNNRLRKYLYRRKLAESDQCECGQSEDPARHLLLEYPKWEAQRRMLRPKVGVRWGDLSYMLGEWNSWKDRRGRTLDGPNKDWKLSVSTVKAVIKFAMDTEKLTHNIESEAEGSANEQRREMDDRAAGATLAG